MFTGSLHWLVKQQQQQQEEAGQVFVSLSRFKESWESLLLYYHHNLIHEDELIKKKRKKKKKVNNSDGYIKRPFDEGFVFLRARRNK